MKRMSFSITKKQIQDQTKTVTRRMGWKNLNAGDLIQPVEKCMGLKKGQKQVLIGNPIKVLNVRFEALWEINRSDIIKEGFPNMTKQDFIEMFCKANKCNPLQRITRIEFNYTNPKTA